MSGRPTRVFSEFDTVFRVLALTPALVLPVLSGCDGPGQDSDRYYGTNEKIVKKLTALGAEVGEASNLRKSGYIHLILGPQWRGEDSALAMLTTLKGGDELTLNSMAIGDDAIRFLQSAPRLKALYLGDTRITDEGFSRLGQLPAVHVLELNGSNYSDECLRSVANLDLNWLTIGPKCSVTDRGMHHVNQMTSLIYLQVCAPQVTDKGVECLKDLDNVRTVALNEITVGEKGLASLAELPRLELLDLAGTELTDQAMTALSPSTTLRQLILDDTQISDQGLRAVSEIPGLEFLSLNRTKTSDHGLPALTQLTQLHSVSLEGTAVTDSALGALSGLGRLKTVRGPTGNVFVFDKPWLARHGGSLIYKLPEGSQVFYWTENGPNAIGDAELRRLRDDEKRVQEP